MVAVNTPVAPVKHKGKYIQFKKSFSDYRSWC